jgi:hypothetical protein
MQDDPIDTISVAPPQPEGEGNSRNDDSRTGTQEVREAHDAEHEDTLIDNPEDLDSKLEVGLDETFPNSDPPASVTPGSADPVPSSGYDEEAERKLAESK